MRWFVNSITFICFIEGGMLLYVGNTLNLGMIVPEVTYIY